VRQLAGEKTKNPPNNACDFPIEIQVQTHDGVSTVCNPIKHSTGKLYMTTL